jgi:hypothetical protein
MGKALAPADLLATVVVHDLTISRYRRATHALKTPE